MLDFYWRKFVDAKVAQEYYLAYSVLSGRVEWGLNAVCLLAGCSGVAAIFSGVPLFGAVLAVSAQIVCALQLILPFGKRKETAGYVYREYTNLVAVAEQTLYRVMWGERPEDTLAAELDRLNAGMEDVEDKYSTSSLFPRNIRLHRRAEKAALQYINVHFETEG